eukprot:4425793-Pleurochrysis_carterae.AAC.1
MPSDGFSTRDAHPDYGYEYDSAPHSLISLMTPEYDPRAFGYSSGLCYIPPRKALKARGSSSRLDRVSLRDISPPLGWGSLDDAVAAQPRPRCRRPTGGVKRGGCSMRAQPNYK